mmetsp:Transcript_3506/g.5401  ORF Transcript_3506/g.5401 Transcript_3506/m.5401 type:complete len:114 (+) Transcript_3506:1409-1750(+)
MEQYFRVYVKAAERKFIAVVRSNSNIKQMLKKLEKVYFRCFGDSKEFLRIKVNGYVIPENYLVEEALEHNDYLELVLKDQANKQPPKNEPQKRKPLPSSESEDSDASLFSNNA